MNVASPAFTPIRGCTATPDASLRERNTFRVAARARLLVEVTDAAALPALFAQLHARHEADVLVLGGGSNVLLTRDWPGAVVTPALRGIGILSETGGTALVRCAAGESWNDFVHWSLAHGLAGLENLALIPGTVGAAPIQNIGAYGLEMCERFAWLRAVELASGESVEFDARACAFGYRDSFFKREGRDRFVITSVTFRLPKAWQPRANYADLARQLAADGYHADGKEPDAQAIFDAVVAVRRAKLPDPLELGNAGSFFKNPVVNADQFEALKSREPDVVSYAQPDGRVKLAAGWLIDRCGWKGRSIGAAAVHERQALVLVNRGGASGADVLALARAIQHDVLERFGVELEAEPVCL